jgi:hypothetical protein
VVVDGNQCGPPGKTFDEDAFDRQRCVCRDGEFPMLDVLMVIIALAFFTLSVGYAYACDRL